MPAYRVSNKPLVRTTFLTETVLDANKNPFTYRTRGPDLLLEVGTVLEDVTEAELAAFGDRLEPVMDAPAPAAETPPDEGASTSTRSRR
jgi:hypothetical protein